MEKLKEDWWKDKKKCEKQDDPSDGISISNIGGVFVVIFVGLILATITLFFEYWFFKLRKMLPKIKQVDVAASNQTVDSPSNDESGITTIFRNKETDMNNKKTLRSRNVNQSKNLRINDMG